MMKSISKRRCQGVKYKEADGRGEDFGGHRRECALLTDINVLARECAQGGKHKCIKIGKMVSPG